jgi:hypothetical protein
MLGSCVIAMRFLRRLSGRLGLYLAGGICAFYWQWYSGKEFPGLLQFVLTIFGALCFGFLAELA